MGKCTQLSTFYRCKPSSVADFEAGENVGLWVIMPPPINLLVSI